LLSSGKKCSKVGKERVLAHIILICFLFCKEHIAYPSLYCWHLSEHSFDIWAIRRYVSFATLIKRSTSNGQYFIVLFGRMFKMYTSISTVFKIWPTWSHEVSWLK
jgi:hypothetical protein